MRILQINARDTYFFREHMILYTSPIGEHSFDMDDDDMSLHLGAFEENKLASVASFYFEKHPYIDGDNHYRVCGMATLPEFRKRGYATSLLKAAYPMIRKNTCSLVWCNVREEAIPFFIKSGFTIRGDGPFDIPGAGKHSLMAKEI